jgi:hypothetical protein
MKSAVLLCRLVLVLVALPALVLVVLGGGLLVALGMIAVMLEADVRPAQPSKAALDYWRVVQARDAEVRHRVN